MVDGTVPNDPVLDRNSDLAKKVGSACTESYSKKENMNKNGG